MSRRSIPKAGLTTKNHMGHKIRPGTIRKNKYKPQPVDVEFTFSLNWLVYAAILGYIIYWMVTYGM